MSLCNNTGSKAGPFTGQRLPVHTQPFAFRAPEEDDESVKMSNRARGRSSALSVALAADDATSIVSLRPARLLQADRRTSPTGHLQNRQFLFDTNKSFSFTTNFSTQRKQSTSFFLFNTNEWLRITDHRSLIISIVARTGKIACATEGSS
jgi:hypothetical protein